MILIPKQVFFFFIYSRKNVYHFIHPLSLYERVDCDGYFTFGIIDSFVDYTNKSRRIF